MEMRTKFSWILFILLATQSSYALEVKTFNLEAKLPKALDLNEVGSPSKLSALSKLKWYQNNGQWQKCVETAEGLSENKTLGVWVAYTHLSCLRSWLASGSRPKPSRLIQSFRKIEANKQLLISSQFSGHKYKLIDTFISLAKLTSEKARGAFNGFIDRNKDIVDYMDREQRGAYYKIMGEIAWLRQKNEIAKANFLRSYRFEPDSAVLNRLRTLKVDHLLELSKYSGVFNQSEAEKNLWAKFDKASRKGQTFNLAKYGSEFLKKFPGSSRIEKVREKMSSVYKRLLYRRGQKYEAVKNDFEGQLLKAPPQHILYWADVAYQRGYQHSAYRLAEKAADKWEGTARAADALIIAGRSAFYLVKRSEAQKMFRTLVEKHSGHLASQEAQYLLGLVYYREGEYKKVVSLYDQFLLTEGSDKWELQVRYWLYRALKKIESPRAKDIAATIFKDFPLTYYGLVVRMEEKQEMQSLFAMDVKKVEASLWWSQKDKARWDRINKLVTLGWLDEAESEIDYMADPQLAPGYVMRAKLWQSAGLMNRAVQDYASAINVDHTYLSRNVLKEAFPQKYVAEVENAEKEFSVSRNLIWAIMRQESAFMPRAISPSNAYGLMQMLSPTARETARWLKVRNFKMPYDIFKPSNSVRFGTHFINRMIRKYKNVIPLAVASYNVGPGNLDRWLSHRSDLSDWATMGQNPDEDMWMDELPWAETSFYVKAVLRNYLLYQIIHQELDKLVSPAWGDAKKVATEEPKKSS